MSYNNKLKEIIKEKGLKQKFIAEKANITEGTLSGIINNKNVPNVEMAIKLAKVLNMTVEEIFWDNDQN